MATQNTNKLNQLKSYVEKSPYIDSKEQYKICQSFGLSYIKSVFQNEYRKRFFEHLKLDITTVATVSKETEIPHKYLCECKAYYEKRDLLKVLYLDRCPTTGSNNVQFVSTNKKVWNNKDLIPKTNQISLFQ